jgi:hypothetical protein
METTSFVRDPALAHKYLFRWTKIAKLDTQEKKLIIRTENMQKHQHGAPVSTKISFLDCIDLSTPDIQQSFSLTNR